MNQIKFTDLLKLSEDEYKHLKLVFHNEWTYNPDKPSNPMPEYVRKDFGNKETKFDLLAMYRNDETELVKKSTRFHDPHPNDPNKNKRFHNGDIVFAFIKYGNQDWLLVNAFRVLDEDKVLVDVDEDYLKAYAPYFGRLVITWPNRKTENIVMTNRATIESLTVKTILEKPYNEIQEEFPGYENINLSWRELRHVLKLENWRTALSNQKGIYLITDTKTGKRYVGKASGKRMLLGRWQAYVETGHGGNEELKPLPFDYIKDNFRYSILDIYKSTTPDPVIDAREIWWKEILLTRKEEYGYNGN